jgi:hypothetical protein
MLSPHIFLIYLFLLLRCLLILFHQLIDLGCALLVEAFEFILCFSLIILRLIEFPEVLLTLFTFVIQILNETPLFFLE